MSDVSRSDRIAPRVPFFTPVHASGLQRCWATNISVGGMGLTGYASTGAALQSGDDLEMEFPLGDLSRPVRAVVRVAWTSRLRSNGHFGFGVQFRELTPGAEIELSRLLAEHRPRVLVGCASEADRQIVETALPGFDVFHLDRAEDLTAERIHTCAAILVLDHDEQATRRFLDTIWLLCPDTLTHPNDLPLAPITLCSDADPDALLSRYSAGKLYEVVRPPLDVTTLQQSVERSCERWALQVELWWASLRLEATAPAQPPPSPTPAVPRVELPAQSARVVRVSAAMQRVYELIQTVAVHEVPVLLNGETGTGKELAAREIHALSKRATTPFIAQDCGALTETLLESELFGHVRGAFTGATSDHPGLFQVADGGTIFLDEIQNTSPALQAKLLRVVEEGEVRPVGGTKPRRVCVRLIAACNVDLKGAVKDGRFRADFFYRLNRFPIELPALRDHTDDIMPLAMYFVGMVCEALERPAPRIDPRMESALVAYRWPGNIRELRNVIERSLLLTPEGEPLRWETLPDEVRGGANADERATPTGTLDAQVEAFERRVIQAALERHDGVIRRAARDLDVNAVTLARKMRRLGIA